MLDDCALVVGLMERELRADARAANSRQLASMAASVVVP